jgi:Ca2+-binding EF-hand superfamily protein
MIFQRLDKNHDGKISKSEAPNRLQQHFDKIDTNHDSAVTPEEFKQALAKLVKHHQDAKRGEPKAEKKVEKKAKAKAPKKAKSKAPKKAGKKAAKPDKK